MRRRILVAILTITTLAVVLFGVPLALVIHRLVDQDATLRLERQAILATRDVPSDFATTGDPVELPSSPIGITLAFYDLHGTLVAGAGPTVADAVTRTALGNEPANAESAGRKIVAVPVAADEAVIGAIRAEESTSVVQARTWRFIAMIAGFAIAVIALGTGVAYLVADRLVRPVRRLRDAAVLLGEGDFTIGVPPSRVAEIDQAGDALVQTARRLDDLMARERAFSADASHQLRTPVAGLRTAIETELEFPRPDRAAILQEALHDLDRLEHIISELLNIARTPRTPGEPIALPDVLSELESAWKGRLALVGRPLTIADTHDCPPVRGSRTMLGHALDALVDNALHHGAGEVRIEHHVGVDTVTISVGDEGTGFPEDPGRDGRGLGLALAARLIEAMPGRLVIPGAGPRPCVDVVLERAV